MIEINNNLCAICLDSMENNNFTQLRKCNHRICPSCAIEVTFQRIPKCSFDRKKIISIQDFTTKQKTFNSIDKYRKFIWINHKESLQEEFENYTSIYLTKAIQGFNVIMLTQNEIYKVLQRVSQNTSNFIEENLNRFKTLFNEFKNYFKGDGERPQDLSVTGMVKEYFDYDPSDKINTIEKLWESDCRDKTVPINLNSVNHFLKTLEEDMSSFIVSMEFDNLINNKDQRGLPNKVKNIIELDIKYGNHIKKRMASFALSNIRKNQDIFKLIHPNMNECDTNYCLVCSEQIVPVSFAKFNGCDHKICLSCIKECVIMHGSCPYHSDNFQDLEIIQNSDLISNEIEFAATYLKNNFDFIFTDLFNKQMENIILAINEIVNIKDIIKDFIDNLTRFFKENGNKGSLKNKDKICQNIFKLVKTFLINSNFKTFEIDYERLDKDGVFSKTILYPLIEKYRGTPDGEVMLTKMKMKMKVEKDYVMKCCTFYEDLLYLTEIHSDEMSEAWEGLIYIKNVLVSYAQFCEIFDLDSMEKEFPSISCLYRSLEPLKCTLPLELKNVAYCFKAIDRILPGDFHKEDVN